MFKNQPQIEVKPTKFDLNLIKLGWLICILHVVFVAMFYIDLPEEIAIHFNLKGKADGFGHKSTIWILPVLGFAMYYALFLVSTKVKPHLFNYPVEVTKNNAVELYSMSIKMMILLNVIIAFLFFILSIETIGGAKGWFDINLGWLTLAFMTLSLLIPFYFVLKMFKVKS